MAGCNVKGACIAIGMIGVCLLILGNFAERIVQALMRRQIADSIPIMSNSSELFSVWADPDVPMTMTYYLLNVTNSPDILTRGAKPHVEYVGPFTYLEKRKKFDVRWNEDRTEMSYVYNRSFHFVDRPCPKNWTKESGVLCSLPNSTVVTTGNAQLMAILDQVDKILPSGKGTNRTLPAGLISGALQLLGGE